MADWNKADRSAVEAAAAAGNLEAQTALRIHQSLDRIGDKIDQLRVEGDASFDRIMKQLDTIRRT